MRRWRLGIAVALAVAGGGYALWCREPAQQGTPDAAVVDRSTARARWRALQRQSPAGIAGTIRGAPSAIACARPLLDDRATTSMIELADNAIRCATGSPSFELTGLAAGRWDVWASAAGKRGVKLAVTLAPGEREVVELVVEDGGRAITGIVRDVRGTAIANALVHAQHANATPEFTTRSAPDGSFAVSTAREGIHVVAVAEGFVTHSQWSEAPASGVAFALLPEAVLAGTVIDAETREPIAGATVNASGTRGETDDTGRFRIAKLAPGRYKPTASALGKYGEAAESVLVRLGRTVDELVIEVHPVAVIAGRIMTPAGPCPADRGRVLANRRGGGAGDWGVTGDGGEVLLEGLVPGPYEVTPHCDGWLAQLPYPDLVVGNSDIEDVTWQVIDGARVSGRVTTRDGAAIANAIVNYYGGDRVRVGSTSTGADGRYVAAGVAPGMIELEVHADGFLSSKATVRATPEAPGSVDVVLDRGAGLSGIVVDEADKPVAGIRVVTSSDGSTETDARGEFELDGLDEGFVTVTTASRWGGGIDERPPDGIKTVRVMVTHAAPARIKLLGMLPRSALEGVVVDHANQPVSDAYVEVARDHGEERSYSWQSERVLTGLDGSFRVTGLPDARFAVRAYRPGGTHTVVAGVLLGERARIVLPRTGTLAGVVVDTSGAPAEDVRIEAKDRARGEYRSERLFRTLGRFSLRDLPAGTYQILADDDPRSAITVTLGEGQTRDDVRVSISQRYSLRGRLVDKARKPLAGWKLDVPHLHETFTTSGGRIVITSTDELAITGTDGSFLVQHIAGDVATISARDPRIDGTVFEVATIPLRGPPTIDVGELVVDQ